jgi:hypothetical protein
LVITKSNFGVMKLFDTKIFDLSCAIKDIDGKKGIVTGYFSAFDNVDADGDIIRRGAFAKTIRENGPKSAKPRIKHLQNHNVNMPLGVLTELKEDATGLAYESNVGTHTLGTDFIKMVESGLITEHSIGFQTLKRNQLQSYEDYVRKPKNGWYEITEVKMWEGSSLTAWGANENTPLTSLKSLDKDSIDKLIAKSAAIEKFCRSTDATDETIELLLIEQKQLLQIILDTQPEEKSVEPEISVVEAIKLYNILN